MHRTRRRMLLSTGAAGLMTLAVAGTAFAAHCTNESNVEGAGQQLVVLLNPDTFAATFVGTNAAGRLTGGFADVYLDLDKSGTLTDADLQIEDDVFIAAGHSYKDNPAQGEPAVIPPIGNGMDPGGEGHGVGG